MYDVYSWSTSNGRKVHIMLEEWVSIIRCTLLKLLAGINSRRNLQP